MKIMKKNILFGVVCVALLTATSCSDFLDVQPEGDARDNAYFLNDQQAIDAVDGLYERFHQEAMYGRELFWEQGAANDIVWGKTRDFPTLATFKYTGDESPLRTVFETMYKVISRSNWVIDQLVDKEKTTALTEIENRSLGEAYFTRGWAHFLMAYRYGTDKQGVPFVRYEDFVNGYDNSIPPQQASVIDNYKLIIEDMENAKKRLPRFEDYDDKDLGRAHQAAAIAFQVKVYAYWAMWDETKWDEVIKLVDELETTYNRGLADTFDELFSSDFSKYWGKEYFALNTHLDHIGVVARREGVSLILDRVNELSDGLPVIVTGDFNAEPESDVIKHMTDAENPKHLQDTRLMSPIVYGPSWSFHDFGKIPYDKRPLIDYVFVRNDLKVLRYGVLAETEGSEFLSDHAPVLVTVE